MLRIITLLAICFAVCVAGSDHEQHHQQSSGKKTPAPNPIEPSGPVDATAYCYACKTRRNQKDLYADPENCHNYYQCFYFNRTYAVGYLRRCAPGLFWHDNILSCMPEGDVPCQDRCRDPAVAGVGMYAGSNCRQYYVCSSSSSVRMCCPSGTRYNDETRLCEDDPTCTASCSQAAPAVQTTIAPPRQFNDTVCVDSFGAYLTAAAESNVFYTIDIETGAAAEKQYCAAGYLFDLATCRCNTEGDSAIVPAVASNRQLLLYSPFTNNHHDESINRFPGFLFDGVVYVANGGATPGSGYLALGTEGGYLAIPGLKAIDYRSAGSWFIAFRCNGVCAAGSVFSTNKDAQSSEFSAQLHLTNANTIVGRLHFWAPVGTVTLSAQFTPQANGWTHVGLTYDGNTALLYVNGAVADSENVGGLIDVAHCVYCFGSDQQFGLFRGDIDSIAIAKFALTQEEIIALRDDDRNALRSLGLI